MLIFMMLWGTQVGICSYLFSCIVWFMCVCTHVQVHACEVVCALCGLYVEVRSQPLLLVLRGYLIGLYEIFHQMGKAGSPEISRHLPALPSAALRLQECALIHSS